MVFRALSSSCSTSAQDLLQLLQCPKRLRRRMRYRMRRIFCSNALLLRKIYAWSQNPSILMFLKNLSFSRKIARLNDHPCAGQLLPFVVSHMMSKVRNIRGGQYWRGICVGCGWGVGDFRMWARQSRHLLYPMVGGTHVLNQSPTTVYDNILNMEIYLAVTSCLLKTYSCHSSKYGTLN